MVKVTQRRQFGGGFVFEIGIIIVISIVLGPSCIVGYDVRAGPREDDQTMTYGGLLLQSWPAMSERSACLQVGSARKLTPARAVPQKSASMMVPRKQLHKAN